uniref:AN1-type domain-containing protein n=1 Tax=viral metagenome TaxID=1070528 RepID=A0A6C0J489_9ZZZZ
MPAKRTKCNNCNLKVKGINIITNKCQCNLVFCTKCRLPENHGCTFNFNNKINLKKKLVKVEFEKINKL